MADGQPAKTEAETLAEEIAAIEREEQAEAAAAKLAADRRRVKRHALKKECEKKYAGVEGRAFVIVEGADDLLFAVKKPDAVIWKDFQSTEKAQTDWEKLYRRCIDPDLWDRVQRQIEDLPLGVENQIVAGIVRMQGGRAEDLLKK